MYSKWNMSLKLILWPKIDGEKWSKKLFLKFLHALSLFQTNSCLLHKSEDLGIKIQIQ
mgnify:CR=1 FL=1